MAICVQAKRTPGCDGPYTKTACAGCKKEQGKCQKTGKKLIPNCGGPFAPIICAYCKRLQDAGDLLDPEMARWLESLNLDTVPLEHVYPDSSPYTPAQIDNRYTKAGDNRIPSPWVKLGNLYMSLTVTGDDSWKALIDKLYGEGIRNFIVFTGRHGQMSGTIVEDLVLKTLGHAVPDETHLIQDKAKKSRIEAEYAKNPRGAIHITLCNVGTTPDTTMTRTKQLAQQCLSAGESVVILAWCYSLLSFYTTTAQADKATRYSDIVCYNLPISDIVSSKLGWAEVEYLKGWSREATSSDGAIDKGYVAWSHSAAVVM
jgi:hypothetical protein